MKNTIQSKLTEIFTLKFAIKSQFSIEEYKILKPKLSAKVMAESLGISESNLSDFEIALKHYFLFRDDRLKSRLVCFRISLWLETICKNLSIDFSIEDSISNEEYAIKQVRALELMIRDLVTENLGGSESVLTKLQSLLKQEIVEKWLKSADESGILSGTTFSELSNVFLDKNIFIGIEDIFKNSNLEIADSARDSLRLILEDIRVIRNAVAHNKKISRIQIEALNEYYDTIVEIIKDSKDTQLNPNDYFNASNLDLDAFLKSLKNDNIEISGDILEIRRTLSSVQESVNRGFDDVSEKADLIHKELKSKWISKKFLFLYTIIFLLAGISVAFYISNSDRPISSKIQLSWVSENAAFEYASMGKINIQIGDYIIDNYISPDGQIDLTDVPALNLSKPVILKFSNPKIYQVDTIYFEKSAILSVKLNIKDVDKAKFLVRDFISGDPINGAKIKFSDVSVVTNEFGEAIIVIPQDKLTKYINIEVLHEGYKYFKMNEVLVDSNLPIELLLERK